MQLFAEGFEVTKTLTELAAVYSSVTSSGLSFDAGRVHGTSLKADHTVLNSWTSPVFASAGGVFNWGRAIKASRFPDNVPILKLLHSSGSCQVSVEVVENTTSDYHLKFYRDTGGSKVLLATTPAAISYNAWHYVEIRFVISNTTGRVIVHVDETEVINLSGQDTQVAASATWDRYVEQLQSRSSGEFAWYDDGYVLNGDGDLNNLIGDVITEAVLPIDDGAVVEWTPSTGTDHYAMVDDASEGDGDSTYLGVTANDKKELHGMSPLAAIGDNIFFVHRRITTKLSSAGSRNIKPCYRDSLGVDHEGTTIVVNSTSYDVKHVVEDLQPVSGLAWTPADLSAGDFGFKTTT